MNLDEIFSELKKDAEVAEITKSLAKRLINRNLSPMKLIQFYSGRIVEGDPLTLDYSTLIERISIKLVDVKIDEDTVRDKGLRQALWFNKKDDSFSKSGLSHWIVMLLTSIYMPTVDDVIDHLLDKYLLKELALQYDQNLLVDVSSKEFSLRKHGLIINDKNLVYPHQFFT